MWTKMGFLPLRSGWRGADKDHPATTLAQEAAVGHHGHWEILRCLVEHKQTWLCLNLETLHKR